MKKKILIFSHHYDSPTGIGTQTKYLIDGLLNQSEDYMFLNIGTHAKVPDNFEDEVEERIPDRLYLQKVGHFGNMALLRNLLVSFEPDVIILFNDPRRFWWLWNNIDEVKIRGCSVLYWHTWDNGPYPMFMERIYNSVDSVVCISKFAYDLLSNRSLKTNLQYIPHTLPDGLFFPIDENIVLEERKKRYPRFSGPDSFMALWVANNQHKKNPGQVLLSWKRFLDLLKKEGKSDKECLLVMHTKEAESSTGISIPGMIKCLGLAGSVVVNRSDMSHKDMNLLYNMCDVNLNLSLYEGFGLPTLEGSYAGCPMMVSPCGGLSYQAENCGPAHKLLPVSCQRMTGDIGGTYCLYETHVSADDVAKSLHEDFYMKKDEVRKSRQDRSFDTKTKFSYKKMIADFHKLIDDVTKAEKKSLYGIYNV